MYKYAGWNYILQGGETLNALVTISAFIIPLIIFFIVGYGMSGKNNVYDDFVSGAKDGMMTVFEVAPTLIGLMVAVGIMRSSGLLDFIGKLLGGFVSRFGLPSQLVPVVIVRMFSSSAATGLTLDIFKEFGTDSYIGTVTSIMMSCTETIFYTMSVYFMAAKVRKTRWTLAGALISTLAGIIASVVIGRFMCS